MTSGSLESQCMFYEDSRCHFHADYQTACHLCFNFASAYKVTDKGKTKAVYTFFDYLKASGNKDRIFPKSEGFQKTL